MDSPDISIEQLNILKHDKDKWTKIGGTVLTLLFVVPFVIFVVAIFRLAPLLSFKNENTSIAWLSGSFGAFMFFFVLFMIAAIVIAIIMFKKRSAYRDAYKKYFSHRVLSSLLEKYQYNHRAGIASEDLGSTGMVRLGNVYRSEDFVSGRYRDVGFVQADLTIQDEHTDSDGNTQTTTYFNGRWLVFEFPRRFVSRLAVVGKGCWQVVYARRMERFETESTEFNRRFKVYMQDGVEMFYLLDPKMIEIMQALSDKYGGKILFLFADKKLHIGINDNTDSFEPPRHQKGDLDEEEEVRRLADEFRTVFELADKLELHKNIFK